MDQREEFLPSGLCSGANIRQLCRRFAGAPASGDKAAFCARSGPLSSHDPARRAFALRTDAHVSAATDCRCASSPAIGAAGNRRPGARYGVRLMVDGSGRPDQCTAGHGIHRPKAKGRGGGALPPHPQDRAARRLQLPQHSPAPTRIRQPAPCPRPSRSRNISRSPMSARSYDKGLVQLPGGRTHACPRTFIGKRIALRHTDDEQILDICYRSPILTQINLRQGKPRSRSRCPRKPLHLVSSLYSGGWVGLVALMQEAHADSPPPRALDLPMVGGSIHVLR